MCTGLALDRLWIDIILGWIGTGSAPDRDALVSDWHQICIRFALDWHYIGTGLGWIGTGLTLICLWIGRIDTELTSDWHLIGVGSVLD